MARHEGDIVAGSMGFAVSAAGTLDAELSSPRSMFAPVDIALSSYGYERSSPSPSNLSDFSIDHVNIRGFYSKKVEREAYLQISDRKPHAVALNETFLDQSIDTITLSGYQLVSRLNRRDGSGWGGIALFVLAEVAPYITFLEHSAMDERSWHVIHSDVGPVLLGIWYRPPRPGEVQSIERLSAEWSGLTINHIGSFIIGDMNVHHIRWLRHSTCISVEGTKLFCFCIDCGLRQTVREPTRNENLLDLTLTDMEELKFTEVRPCIADHNIVMNILDLRVPIAAPRSRKVFEYTRQIWKRVTSICRTKIGLGSTFCQQTKLQQDLPRQFSTHSAVAYEKQISWRPTASILGSTRRASDWSVQSMKPQEVRGLRQQLQHAARGCGSSMSGLSRGRVQNSSSFAEAPSSGGNLRGS